MPVSDPRKVLFFVGAPDASSLTWDEDDLTVCLLPAFQTTPIFPPSKPLASTDPVPVWRSIALQHQHLPTGISQIGKPTPQAIAYASSYDDDAEETSFLDMQELSSTSSSSATGISEAPAILSQFYEHSFALHDALPSPQIVPVSTSASPASTLSSNSISSEEEHSASLLDAPSHMPRSLATKAKPPPSSHLTTLRDIPPAAHLRAINPQTVTVNLVVGIIAISPPKMITTRRDGRLFQLVEMTVGDETRAGFGINFWLPGDESQVSALRDAVKGLRPQDVVLVRNVALSQWRANVYGQSLRREVTKVWLLWRKVVGREDVGGVYGAKDFGDDGEGDALVAEVKSVKNWVMDFVGAGLREGVGRSETREKRVQALPPDTQ